MANINILDKDGMKSIDFSPWGGIDGFLNETSGSGVNNLVALRAAVPWLQKGVTMTGNAVSQLPYCIEDAADNEVDSDRAWGAVRDPRKFIKLVADSLCGGQAYLLVKTTSRALVSMQYVLASSMSPNFDGSGNVTSFTRSYGNKRVTVPLEEVVYFWLPDDTVETGPAQVYPLRNATLPAQLIAGMDSSLKQYADRGFIPPTILAVKGMPNASEREKSEKWWNAFLRGWTRTAAKIVNAETVTPQVVGAGMDELRGTYNEITRQQIENIASSFDIPMSLFMSNAANYATANSDRKTWYETGTFVTIYQCIEDAFNEQLWKRFGWRMEFEPEKIDAFMEDETQKAGSVATLASSLAANPAAFVIVCDVLGIELSDEVKAEIAMLADVPEMVTMPESETAVEDTSEMSDIEDAEAIADEMAAWRNFAGKKHGRDFEPRHIPLMVAVQIKARLKAGEKPEQVFADALRDLPTITLASAINRAAHE